MNFTAHERGANQNCKLPCYEIVKNCVSKYTPLRNSARTQTPHFRQGSKLCLSEVLQRKEYGDSARLNADHDRFARELVRKAKRSAVR